MLGHGFYYILITTAFATSGALGYYLHDFQSDIKCEVASAYPAEKAEELSGKANPVMTENYGFAPLPNTRSQAQQSWFPNNGETRWHKPSADGANVGYLVFEENSRALNRTILVKSRNGDNIVSVAVRAGMGASVPVPAGQYYVQVQGFTSNDSISNPPSQYLNKPLEIKVATEQRSRILLFAENGQTAVNPVTAPKGLGVGMAAAAVSSVEHLESVVNNALNASQISDSPIGEPS